MAELPNKYDAVALYSGGVDSTVAPILARERIGSNILLLMINLGESNGKTEEAKHRADILGMDFEVIDGRREFADQFLSEAIRMNGSYWGYPLITPLSRAYMIGRAFEFLADGLETPARYVIHGCTARQNTRFRIEKMCAMESNLAAVGPLVTQSLTRKEKLGILEQHGIVNGPGSEIAEDENIWGRAIEGDPLNDLRDADEKGVFMITQPIVRTPDDPDRLTLEFTGGIPIRLNDHLISLDEIITQCAKTGALHGVGRIIGFEDTIPELGYKEMGIYESPASGVIYAAHRFIEAAVFSHTERRVKRDLEQQWAEIVYRGGWYEANRREISEFARPFQEKVRGTVELKLFKGHVQIGESDIPGHRLITRANSRGAY